MVEPKINFTIDEFLYKEEFRIVVFKIPAAVNQPTTFMGKPYIRVDSHVTGLSGYNDWMREIYNSQVDWSAQIIEEASIDDLDQEAIRLARDGYKLRYPDFADDVEKWTDETFLDKANLTRDGCVTRAAMLLVGKSEKVHKLNHIAQIVWKCFQEGDIFGDIYTNHTSRLRPIYVGVSATIVLKFILKTASFLQKCGNMTTGVFLRACITV